MYKGHVIRVASGHRFVRGLPAMPELGKLTLGELRNARDAAELLLRMGTMQHVLDHELAQPLTALHDGLTAELVDRADAERRGRRAATGRRLNGTVYH